MPNATSTGPSQSKHRCRLAPPQPTLPPHPHPLPQYLLQDLLYTTVLASVMGFTHPAKRLSKTRPPARLMSLGIWLPVMLQFATCALFQVRGAGKGSGEAAAWVFAGRLAGSECCRRGLRETAWLPTHPLLSITSAALPPPLPPRAAGGAAGADAAAVVHAV